MPDRPGALGQVASRVGAVRGDVLGIEILEQGADRVIDELTVLLPSADLVDLLCQEIDAVDGVAVEDVRTVDLDRADPSLAALAAASMVAEAAPSERVDAFGRAVHRLIDADWAVVLRGGEVIAAAGEPPDVGWLTAFLAGSDHLTGADEVLGDIVLANLVSAQLTVAAGRSGRTIHERERIRVSLLARLADALL